MNRLAGLIAFELRYQAWRPTFVVSALCLGFVAVALVATTFGPKADAVNGAFLIAESAALLSLVSVFVLPLLCVHAALRDDEHGMRALIDVQPVSRRLLLALRFGGVLALLVAVLALAVGLLALTPRLVEVPADRLVPFTIAPYGRAFVWIIVPNAIWCSALLFAVATATRSTLATFVASACIYAGYFVTALMVDSPLMAGTRPPTPELLARAARLDPFGLSAVFEHVRYLTPTDRATFSLSASGRLLTNRLLVMSLAVVCLFPVAWWDARVATRGSAARGAASGTTTLRRWLAHQRDRFTRALRAGSRATTTADAQRGAHVARDRRWWPATRAVAGMETQLLLRSWPFLVLLVVWVATIAIEADGQLRSGEYGTRVLASTSLLADAVPQALALLGSLCVMYFAAEVFSREHVTRFAAIHDAAPAPDSAVLVGKTVALLVVPTLLTLTGYGTTLAAHLLAGGLPVAWSVLAGAVAISLAPLVITTLLAASLQWLFGQRWLALLAGLLVLLFTAQGAGLGAVHPLWRFGAAPSLTWSDLRGFGPELASWLAFEAHWLLGALMLASVALRLAPRGERTSLGARVRRATGRLRARREPLAFGVVLALCLAFTGSTATLWWLTTVRTPWRTEHAEIARRVDYERRYARLRDVPQPSITHVVLDVDLDPRHARADLQGVLHLTNTSEQWVDTLWLTAPGDVRSAVVGDGDGRIDAVEVDVDHGVHRISLTRPLAPGDSVQLTMRWWLDDGGIRADGRSASIAPRATFLHSADVLPTLGFARSRVLRDSLERARRGLPTLADDRLAPASAADSLAQLVQRRGADPAWFSSAVTIHTDAEHVALGPGALVRQERRAGRSTWSYRQHDAATPAFVITSAPYRVRCESVRTAAGVVPVEIWHTTEHTEPAARLLDVTTRSLRRLIAYFGAYPHAQLRVVEVAHTIGFAAYAMPGTILLSETRGLLSDARAEDVDLLLRRVGHEVAHQWWGHAVSPLPVEGRLLLVETLAKHAEQVLVAQAQGEDMVHEMLAFDEDRYLRSRTVTEPSLVAMRDEDALYYGKGALAMHAMRHLLGDSVVQLVVRDLLVRDRGAHGTATAQQFVADLTAHAPTEDVRTRIREWFTERVVYDAALDSAAFAPRGRGTHVTATFQVRRHAIDRQAGRPIERVTPLDDVLVPVGLRDDQARWHVHQVRARDGVVRFDDVVPFAVRAVEFDPERIYVELDRTNNGMTRQ